MDKGLFPVIHPQVAATITDNQVVIVLADSGQVMVVNELGTHLWKLSNGSNSIGQIVQLIADEYEVDITTAERDVFEFLQQMIEIQALILQETPSENSG